MKIEGVKKVRVTADGRMITFEFDPFHAALAKANFTKADLNDIIEMRVGRALELLPGIESAGEGPLI